MNTLDFSEPAQNSICPLTASPVKRAVADQQVAAIEQNFPKGIATPAMRALINAGYTNLEQLINAKKSNCMRCMAWVPRRCGFSKPH